MKDIELNTKELLYLSVLAGIENIWGVPDAFHNMCEEDLRMEVIYIQQSLRSKRYSKSVFDNGFAAKDELITILVDCAKSERVYLLGASSLEASNRAIHYYVSHGVLIRYERQEDDQFFSLTTADAFSQEIAAVFSATKESTVQFDAVPLLFSAQKMRRLGSLSRRRFLEELSAIGCNDRLSTLIVDGLQGDANYCSLVELRNDNGRSVVADKLVTLCFGSGSLLITPDQPIEKDVIRFSVLNSLALHDSIQRILCSVNQMMEEPQ